jgi:hypothetical protein
MYHINFNKMQDERENQRISQGGFGTETAFRSILDEASDVARGVLGSIQEVAGTTACKGVQLDALKKYAIEHQCWFYDPLSLGTFVDRGSENEVYVTSDKMHVIKFNDFRYSEDNLTPFYERIRAHNLYFPECAYQLIGFGLNQLGRTCAVLEQSLIQIERMAAEEEIDSQLQSMGFIPCLDGEYYSNGEHDLFDVTPQNVLVGVDGGLYFIDVIIYLTDDLNWDRYRSTSPRFIR